MPDYFATLKIQQGRMKSAMRTHGIQSAKALATLAGVPYAHVLALLNFKMPPKNVLGEWHASVMSICRVLCSEPDDIFPEHLQHELATNRIGSFVEHAQLSGHYVPQRSPADVCMQSDTRDHIFSVLNTLPTRDQEVLHHLYFKGLTKAATARAIGVSRERISQLERCALKRMRHPTRIKMLQNALE